MFRQSADESYFFAQIRVVSASYDLIQIIVAVDGGIDLVHVAKDLCKSICVTVRILKGADQHSRDVYRKGKSGSCLGEIFVRVPVASSREAVIGARVRVTAGESISCELT